jgi:hypothetical protein
MCASGIGLIDDSVRWRDDRVKRHQERFADVLGVITKAVQFEKQSWDQSRTLETGSKPSPGDGVVSFMNSTLNVRRP